jgi:hypothetical protein
MAVVGMYSSGEKRGDLLFYPQYILIAAFYCCPVLALALPRLGLLNIVVKCRRACMHGVDDQGAFRCVVGAYGNGRLFSPCACTSNIGGMYGCKGGMVLKIM